MIIVIVIGVVGAVDDSGTEGVGLWLAPGGSVEGHIGCALNDGQRDNLEGQELDAGGHASELRCALFTARHVSNIGDILLAQLWGGAGLSCRPNLILVSCLDLLLP